MKTVAVIGASDKPERYSNMAMHDLKDHGYDGLTNCAGCGCLRPYQRCC